MPGPSPTVSRLLSRRVLLRGAVFGTAAAGLAPVLAGCENHRTATPAPGAAELAAALAAENALIAAYDTALAAGGRPHLMLTQNRADHAAHRRALLAAGAQPATAASPSPVGSSAPVSSVAALVRAEHVAARSRTAAAIAGPRHLAALFASIAASEATHVVRLKGGQ